MSGDAVPDLDAIKARVDVATPGPWEVDSHSEMEQGCRCMSCWLTTVWQTTNGTFCEDTPEDRVGGPTRERCDQFGYTYEDAEFIAAARADVPALVAEVERLRAEIAGAEGQQ